MAFTEVILTANISSLGAEADIVKVRRGYARNFLLPNGKALEINSGSLRQINHLKAKRAEREAREVTAADELASKINKLSPVFTLDAGETGKAFGSVTAKDIHDRIVADLKLEELQQFSALVEKDVFAALTLEGSLESRSHIGGTAPARVKAAIAKALADSAYQRDGSFAIAGKIN